MPTIKEVIEGNDTPLARFFDLAVQCLIVLSLLAFSIETLPDISDSMRKSLRRFELVTVTAFTCEYLARLVVSDNKLKFATSFFGVVDLLAILPFYIASGVDMSSIRAFRLLRLIRIFKLARYSVAVQRFHRAFLIAREEIILFAFVTMILMYLSAVGIYYFENPHQPESCSHQYFIAFGGPLQR